MRGNEPSPLDRDHLDDLKIRYVLLTNAVPQASFTRKFMPRDAASDFARHLIGFACRTPELSRHLRFYQNHREFEQRISGSSRNMRKGSCTLPYTNACQR